MKKLWKVLLSVLAFAVVFACVLALGTSADTKAAITENTDDAAGLFRVLDASGTEIGKYKLLKSAVDAAPDGGRVEVTADYNAAYASVLMQDAGKEKSITVDLMGHTVYESSLWTAYSQYFLVRNGYGLKITSSVGRGRFVFSKYMLLVQADSNTNTGLTNNVEIENIDIESAADGFYAIKAGTGKLTMKDVSIKATSGNIQPIHLQRDVNSASLDVTMDNVVIDSARNGIRYNANGTTAFALNLTLNNCKLTSEYYAYKTDGAADPDGNGAIHFVSVASNNDSINLVLNSTEIYTNMKVAITAEQDPQISVTADKCTVHTNVNDTMNVDGAQIFRAAHGLTKSGTIKFTSSDLSVYRRLVDTGYGAIDSEHNTSFVFDNCRIYSKAADCIAVAAGNNFTFGGIKTRLISPNVNVWDRCLDIDKTGASGTAGTIAYGYGVRAAGNNVSGFAEDGLETDGCRYVYGATKYEGSQQGDNSVYNNQTYSGVNYGTETKDVVNPKDGQLYRQLWVYGKGAGTNNTYPWLNPTKASIAPGSNLKYLAFEMDISVLEDMPDETVIYFTGRKADGTGWCVNSDKNLSVVKTTGGVNITFNGATQFLRSGHWAHLTMVFRLSTEVVDGANQSAVAVFVDGKLLSSVSSGYFTAEFAKISDGRVNPKLRAAEGTNAHINIANIRLASYANADFESNVFSANPTVEGSDYLSGAKSDMADFPGVSFHFTDGTVEEGNVSVGDTATTVGGAFFAKQATLAYNAGKVLLGWSRTEGGGLFSGTLTQEEIDAGLDFYPVLATFTEAKDTVQAVMLEGTTVKAYINSDNFHTIDASGAKIAGAPLANITVGSKTYIILVNDMTVYGAAEITGSGDMEKGALTKVYFDLNGHTFTADYANWRSNSTYKYAFRTVQLVTFYVYSSAEGAVADMGNASLVMQNHTHEVYIGANSSKNAKQGQNPYAGNLTIKTDDYLVRNNAADGLHISGVTINAGFGISFRALTKRSDYPTLIFAVRDSDITVANSFISFSIDGGQTSGITATMESSTLFVGGRFIDNPPASAVSGANIATDVTVTNSTVYANDASVPEKVTGKITVIAGNTYVNAAPGIVLDTGKALRPTVVNKNGVTFTKTVAGENEIAGVKFNLTLYSSFNLNLYVLSEYGLGGDTVEIDGYTYTKREYSYAAHEIAKAQSIKLGSFDAISVSVLDYAKALFALDDSALMTNEKTLMADALVYANAAAKLIGGSENAEITALLTANKAYKSPLKTFNGVAKDMTSVSDGFVSASLDLTSQPRFIFTIKSGAKVSVSYTNFWGVKVTKTEADAVDGKIIIDDMRIFDFANEFTLTVGEKRTTYSLADYAANTDVQELCNALYTYIETAKAFKAANPKVQ